MVGILSQLFGGGAGQPVDQRPLIDRFSNVAGGNLSGELSTSDKLIALSQLMRSMTRSGRRAGLTPGDVIQNLQAQKATELQNKMQIEQLRKQAAEDAQASALKNQYLSRISDPKTREELSMLPASDLNKIIVEEYTGGNKVLSGYGKRLVDLGYTPGTAEFQQGMSKLMSQGRYTTTPEGWSFVPGVNLPAPTSTPTPPVATSAPPEIIQQRPGGMTDDELIAKARAAIREGIDVNLVFKQLAQWGVNP